MLPRSEQEEFLGHRTRRGAASAAEALKQRSEQRTRSQTTQKRRSGAAGDLRARKVPRARAKAHWPKSGGQRPEPAGARARILTTRGTKRARVGRT